MLLYSESPIKSTKSVFPAHRTCLGYRAHEAASWG